MPDQLDRLRGPELTKLAEDAEQQLDRERRTDEALALLTAFLKGHLSGES